jgi:hypothetical protein
MASSLSALVPLGNRVRVKLINPCKTRVKQSRSCSEGSPKCSVLVISVVPSLKKTFQCSVLSTHYLESKENKVERTNNDLRNHINT